MVRSYVVVRHSGQNWYWGILKRRLLGVQLARPQTSGQRGEKKVSPLLDYGTHIINSSKTVVLIS